jgi:hypothetical protein
MTQDEIIEMARFAGGCDITSNGWVSWVGTQSTEFLERFANLVAAKALAQRTWVGLTEEEIKTICVENGWDSSWQSMRFAHAIEAKLKQKNGYAEENT